MNLDPSSPSPSNQGEMRDADAVGTVGSPDCGDMVRLWIKFAEKDGQKIIDRASFQSFGCQTAMAVAQMATEMLRGKTVEEAQNYSGKDLSAPLGPLPPMKIHCAQLVEDALRNALNPSENSASSPPAPATHDAPTLWDKVKPDQKPSSIKIVPLDK